MNENVPGEGGLQAPKHAIDIEGIEYHWHGETITVLELRDLAGIEPEVILIEIDHENNERQLGHGETLHLKHGHRYGKKPHYKRGSHRIQEEKELLTIYFPRLQVREV